MDTFKNPKISFPVMSVLGAAIVTLLVFIFIDALTNMVEPPPPDDHDSSVLIHNIFPPKTPEPTEFEEKEPSLFNPVKNIVPDNKPTKRDEITPPNLVPDIDYLVDVEVKGMTSIKGMPGPVIPGTFAPFQVDRQPYITKYVHPIYPFAAKSSGIEGRVVLRFIVDEKGFVLDPEVLNAEPEGIFEKAALAAIMKYRFKPATIGIEPVKCYAVLPIGFRLNE